jgi:hypothetical protein
VRSILRQVPDWDRFFDQYKNKTICGEWFRGVNIVSGEPKVYFFDEMLPAVFKKPFAPAPTMYELPSQEMLDILCHNFKDMEGVVISYTNTKTGETYRLKHYTSWYLILRGWFKYIYGGARNKDSSATTRKVALTDIARDHTIPSTTDQWDRCAAAFATWFQDSEYIKIDMCQAVHINVARIWDAFMRDYNAVLRVQP